MNGAAFGLGSLGFPIDVEIAFRARSRGGGPMMRSNRALVWPTHKAKARRRRALAAAKRRTPRAQRGNDLGNAGGTR